MGCGASTQATEGVTQHNSTTQTDEKKEVYSLVFPPLPWCATMKYNTKTNRVAKTKQTNFKFPLPWLKEGGEKSGDYTINGK